MQPERTLQRLRHRQARIERGVGILKHDLDIASKRLEVRSPQFRQELAAPADRARRSDRAT